MTAFAILSVLIIISAVALLATAKRGSDDSER